MLILIDTNPAIIQSEIGRMLAIKRANMVPLSAMIERNGFVTRTAGAGRAVSLFATAAGARAARMAQSIMQDNDEAQFGSASGKDRQLLASMLDLLWRKAE